MSTPSYAIIETGSKQYRVSAQDVIEVEKLKLPADSKEVTLDRVLLVSVGDKIQIGAPFVSGAKVICDYLESFRAPKVISFKYRRRKASRRKRGHRQDLMRLRVKAIEA